MSKNMDLKQVGKITNVKDAITAFKTKGGKKVQHGYNLLTTNMPQVVRHLNI